MRYTRLLIGTLVTVGLLAALWVSPASAQPGFNPPGLDVAIAAQEAHTDALLRIQGVVGTAVGLGAGGQPVVKIYTESAGVAGLPRTLDGVPVVVQVTGKIFALGHCPEHAGGKPPPGCGDGDNGGNNAPTANDQSVSTQEGISVVITLTGSDADGCDSSSFMFSVTSGPTNGSLSDSNGPMTCSDSGDLATSVTYTPATNFNNGTDSFSYTVDDGVDTSDPATVTITVGNVVDPKTRFDRPVPIGVSSGSERLTSLRGPTRCTVGTLGARLVDSAGILYYALSNNHIYALEGQGEVDDPILQPGRVDMTDQACGSTDEINNAVIGTLHAFVPIVFSRTANNRVDAAVATVHRVENETGVLVNAVGTSTPADGYGTPKSETVFDQQGFQLDNLLDSTVQKYGRTTSLTSGTIDGINATILVRYDSGQARFVEQIEVGGSGFSAGGDSGSLIVTEGGNNPVALLFAGGSDVTFGNPIADVLSELAEVLELDPLVTLTIDGE